MPRFPGTFPADAKIAAEFLILATRSGTSYSECGMNRGLCGVMIVTVTEDEWLACIHPKPMLAYLRGPGRATRTNLGRRKLRLFGCSCCRRAWAALADERSRQAVEQAEHYADGRIDSQGLWRAYGPARQAFDDAVQRRQATANAALIVLDLKAWGAASVWRTLASKQSTRLTNSTPEKEQAAQAALLRCIFGNPFRSVIHDPAWRTWRDGLLVSMARQMYGSRDFSAMPILADALEEAGCTNSDILSHCRSSGEHVRGCWVIDLLLGKE